MVSINNLQSLLYPTLLANALMRLTMHNKNMSNKLPKHIAQMVEKNNLVLAIKSLSEEQNISMSEAKDLIDDYEQSIKQKQNKKVEAISQKQNKRQSIRQGNQPIKDNPKLQSLNSGLDNRLNSMGYKPPMVPYWVKRVFVILLVIAILSLLFWRLMPK